MDKRITLMNKRTIGFWFLIGIGFFNALDVNALQAHISRFFVNYTF